MQKRRISWVDVARGIGILLVVYGHALSADSLRFLIYSFHMPLFFFLSGLVFTYRPEEGPGKFLRKNIRSLLYPYILFAVLSFFLWIITRQPPFPEQVKQFLSIFYGNGNNGLLAFNNLLWFLPCLFIIRTGFYAVRSVTGEKKYLLAILAAFSVIGYLYSLFFSDWKLIFGIETALTAIVFFGAGYLLKIAHEQKQEHAATHLWPILAVTIFGWLIFAFLNYQTYGLQVDLRLDRLNNYIYFYLAAFSGIIMTVTFSQLIGRNALLEYLGKNSLVIFAWHFITFPYLSQIFRLFGISAYFFLLPPVLLPIIYSLASIGVVLGISRFISFSFRLILQRAGSRLVP